jgi:SAM-dependent methyltransferase
MNLPSLNCPSCLGKAWDPLFVAKDPHYSIKGSWNIDRCAGCGVWRLGTGSLVPTGTSEYPDDYYAYSSDNSETTSKLPSNLAQRLGRLLKVGTREPKLPPGRMIDLGCGDGKVVEEYEKEGWSAIGVEPDFRAVEAAKNKGRNVVLGTLSTAQGLELASYDLIRSNHAFEHVENPRDCLERTYELLKPGATGFIGVPNTRSFNALLFRSNWFYLGAPVHFYNYSPTNLTRMLESVGFSNVSVRFNSRPAALLGNIQIQISAMRSGPYSSRGRIAHFPPFLGLALIACKLLDFIRLGDSIEATFTKPLRSGSEQRSDASLN